MKLTLEIVATIEQLSEEEIAKLKESGHTQKSYEQLLADTFGKLFEEKVINAHPTKELMRVINLSHVGPGYSWFTKDS